MQGSHEHFYHAAMLQQTRQHVKADMLSSTTPYLRQEGHRHGTCQRLYLCWRCCKDAGPQEAVVTQTQCDEHCTYVGTSSQCCPARCWCHILCQVRGVKQLQGGWVGGGGEHVTTNPAPFLVCGCHAKGLWVKQLQDWGIDKAGSAVVRAVQLGMGKGHMLRVKCNPDTAELDELVKAVS
jgi:hypothetical protein